MKPYKLGLLLTLISASTMAESNFKSGTAASLAFARYISSIDDRDPFTQTGPVAVTIEGSLPGLYKQSGVIAIRQPGESGRPEHQVLQMLGDATVMQEVIVPYLKAVAQIDDLPMASVAVTPVNYKFRYVGEVGNGDMLTYVFAITPKRKQHGLLEGRLWIDALTGAAVLQTGHSVKPPSTDIHRIQVVRETQFAGGVPCVRITHVAVETGRVGHGELTITEQRLIAAGEPAPSQRIVPSTAIR